MGFADTTRFHTQLTAAVGRLDVNAGQDSAVSRVHSSCTGPTRGVPGLCQSDCCVVKLLIDLYIYSPDFRVDASERQTGFTVSPRTPPALRRCRQFTPNRFRRTTPRSADDAQLPAVRTGWVLLGNASEEHQRRSSHSAATVGSPAHRTARRKKSIPSPVGEV